MKKDKILKMISFTLIITNVGFILFNLFVNLIKNQNTVGFQLFWIIYCIYIIADIIFVIMLIKKNNTIIKIFIFSYILLTFFIPSYKLTVFNNKPKIEKNSNIVRGTEEITNIYSGYEGKEHYYNIYCVKLK